MFAINRTLHGTYLKAKRLAHGARKGTAIFLKIIPILRASLPLITAQPPTNFMGNKILIALIVLSVGLYGCSRTIEKKYIDRSTVEADGIEISKVGSFLDNSAYNSERCIYRITDTK